MRALQTSLVPALSLIVGGSLMLSSANAQTTVATVPVGFTQQVITPATDASNPASTVFSVPFYNTAAYAAGVSTVDSSSAFSNTSASWTAGQFAAAATPYLAHFKSGNSVGRYFLITSNTANQITVANRGYDLSSTVAAGDSFEIVPANTLGILFGTTSVPFQTSTDPTTADNLYLWNGSSFVLYYHDGTKWRKSGSIASQNNTVLYPDEGFFLTRRSTSALTLTFLGTVPSTTERSDVVGPGSTFVANRFPANTTLLATGLASLANWQSSTDPTAADNVYLWNGSSWVLYYYNGTNWRKSGSIANANNTVIPAGSSVFVVRQSTATGTAASLAQALPYSLN